MAAHACLRPCFVRLCACVILNACACAGAQVDSGAQVLQLFESWAHHLGPDDWSVFAKPYADRVVSIIKAKARPRKRHHPACARWMSRRPYLGTAMVEATYPARRARRWWRRLSQRDGESRCAPLRTHHCLHPITTRGRMEL